jgi:hypothetical protein
MQAINAQSFALKTTGIQACMSSLSHDFGFYLVTELATWTCNFSQSDDYVKNLQKSTEMQYHDILEK